MRFIVASLITLACAGCRGPSTEEIASAVLLVAPFFFALTWGTLWLLHRLWRRQAGRTRATMASRPTHWLLVVGGLGALAALVIEPRGVNLSPLAFWGAGTSHLTLTLVLWRGWFGSWPGAFAYAQLPPAAATFVFAAVGLGGSDLDGVSFFYWLVPGYAGLITAPLLLLLLLEAWLRGRP